MRKRTASPGAGTRTLHVGVKFVMSEEELGEEEEVEEQIIVVVFRVPLSVPSDSNAPPNVSKKNKY